jgi:hypothetical protein
MVEKVHDPIANGCCTAMWKANGKTTTLQLSWTVSLQKHSVWKRL